MDAETIPATATDSALMMRAHMAADLADARRITEQVKTNTPFARFRDQSDAALFRALLEQSRHAANRAACLLHDETFVPCPDGEEAA